MRLANPRSITISEGNFTLPADCRDLTKPENHSAEWLQRVPAKAGDCIIFTEALTRKTPCRPSLMVLKMRAALLLLLLLPDARGQDVSRFVRACCLANPVLILLQMGHCPGPRTTPAARSSVCPRQQAVRHSPFLKTSISTHARARVCVRSDKYSPRGTSYASSYYDETEYTYEDVTDRHRAILKPPSAMQWQPSL